MIDLFTILLCSHIIAIQASGGHEAEIAVAKWHFSVFATHITVMIFLLVTVFIKIGYHKLPYMADYVPESLILIIIGIIFGAVVHFALQEQTSKKSVWNLTPELFFHYLLPPIILEAAYNLYNRTFSEHLGVVLLFAVLGTIFNFFIIGFAMFGLFKAGAFGQPALTFDIKGFLLFSSLIVAVDPVAVLAIFQEIGVELSLYYIVFGESLLNDAITVVLYEIMVAFIGQDVISGSQIGLGIASFFTVSFGGLLIGVVFGILTCLITRVESHLNAFTLILLAYFSYIMADCVGWSGIISMIGCGLVQAAYAFHNLDRHSVTMVHHLTKLVAEISESVIFLFLGFAVVSNPLAWHTGFVLWGIVLCLTARTVVILAMTAIMNLVSVDGTRIGLTQQVILIYGGLRGAVAFSLAILVPEKTLGESGEYKRHVIITTTLIVILFTVGFMGLTMKPLVKLLRIRRQGTEQLSLFHSLNNNIMDTTLAGVETILGKKGRNVVRDIFIRLDEKYFRRLLQRDPEHYDEKLFKLYEDISLKLHYAQIRPEKRDEILRDVPEQMRYKYLFGQTTDFNLPDLPANNLSNAKHNLHRAEDGTASVLEANTAEMDNLWLHPRRASLIPHRKRQLDYDETFMNIVRSRNRALCMNMEVPDKYDHTDDDDYDDDDDEDDDGDYDVGVGGGVQRSSKYRNVTRSSHRKIDYNNRETQSRTTNSGMDIGNHVLKKRSTIIDEIIKETKVRFIVLDDDDTGKMLNDDSNS